MPLHRQYEATGSLHPSGASHAGQRADESSTSRAAAKEARRKARKKENHVPVLLLIVVLASLATLMWYRAFLSKYNQGLHRSVVANLQQLFPDAIVQLGSVSADGPDKIIVNNLQLASSAAHPRRPIVTIHRAVLHGDLDIANWVQNTIRVTHIDLHGVRVDVWRNAHDVWSVQTLKPHPLPNAVTPSLRFQDVTLRLFSEAGPKASVLSLSDLQGSVEPIAVGAMAGSVPPVAVSKPPLEVQLSCRSTGLIKRLKLTGVVDLTAQTWSADGAVDNLNFSPRLLEALPAELSQLLSQLAGLECIASSHFRVARQAEGPVAFELQGRILSGRLRDPRLPYPLDKVRGDFFCNNQILQLHEMRASSGDASLTLSSDIMGFGRDVPMVIHATANNLEIDGRLREALPAGLQTQWDRLQPSGHVSGDLQLNYNGQAWTPIASIACHNVALKPWLFPYPLEDIQGQVRYQAGTISTENLTGTAGGQPITAQFSLSRQADQWYGRLNCQTGGALAIEETLLAALTAEGQETSGVERFIRSLHPRGTVQVIRADFFKETPDEPMWHRQVDLHVMGGGIKYDHFPYPIHEIQGRIAGQDNRWWLDQFQGSNDSGQILCSGNWSTDPDVNADPSDGVPFELHFQATAVPIEEELQRALPKDAQFVWDELQPSGSIDRIEVQLSKRPGFPLATRVGIVEQSESNQQAGRALRMQPKNFPLWLSDIDCNIQYEPGRLTIEQASGVNGDSRLAIQGECLPQADGRWLANIQWLPRTRLIVDGPLLRALPKTIRDSLVRIDYRGPVGVLGRSRVLFPNEADPTVDTAWDCQLDIENGQFGDGRVIGGMRGTLLSQGSSDGINFQAAGTIEMDALNVYSVPLTRLRGPYAIADNMLYFGTEVSGKSSEDTRQSMTADALTGRVTLAGVGRLVDGKLILRAQLDDAELSGLLRDVGVERASTQARCDAKLNFSGIPWNSQMWRGDGEIHLTDAKLFQLPFMMRLLGTASVNADDDSAFQTADIDFTIDGDRIPLQVKCEGEVLRLRGEGWTNLRREIGLELYSYVGRRPIYNMVAPLIPESRYATFMMIEVDGTLDNPNMQRRPFPQLEATLQQIFPEVVQKGRMDGLVPWR